MFYIRGLYIYTSIVQQTFHHYQMSVTMQQLARMKWCQMGAPGNLFISLVFFKNYFSHLKSIKKITNFLTEFLRCMDYCCLCCDFMIAFICGSTIANKASYSCYFQIINQIKSRVSIVFSF